MSKAQKKLKENNGVGMFVSMAIMAIIDFMFLTLILSAISVYSTHSNLGTIAHELARHIEVRGVVDSSTDAEFVRLKGISNVSGATVTYSQTGRIQLEEPFTVTVSLPKTWGVGGVRVEVINIQAQATGRSEVYWK